MFDSYRDFRAPDYSKAIDAAGKILDLLERTPKIDNGSTSGEELVSNVEKIQI